MDSLGEEGAAGKVKERQRKAVKASRGAMRGGSRKQGTKGKRSRWGAVVGSKGPCEGVLIKATHHEISPVIAVLSLVA